MTTDSESLQEREWEILHDRIDALLGRFGTKNAFRRGDYWIRDDNWGLHEHSIEIQNLALLEPAIVESLRRIVSDYPDWEIVVSVDVPGTENAWPRMGIVVQPNKIIDGLQRDFLPEPFRSLHYEGSRRLFDAD